MRAKPKTLEELLWDQPEGPKRGPKPTLSLERVVSTGIRIADAEGLDALSMQRVAADLEAATMALYRHVPGKHELVLLMLDAAFGTPPPVDPSRGWRVCLADWARANWRVFLAHRWTLSLVITRRAMGPNEAAWAEAALRAMEPTGLSPRVRLDLLVVLNAYVRGVAAALTGEPDLPVDRLARSAEAGQYVLLASAIGVGADGGANALAENDLGARFESGLHRVLDGIEDAVPSPADPVSGTDV